MTPELKRRLHDLGINLPKPHHGCQGQSGPIRLVVVDPPLKPDPQWPTTTAERYDFAMRFCAPLLLLIGCAVAQRPPPPRPAPRFSVEAEQQREPDLCRRMADWDCIGLDCPDCSSVAQKARTRDVAEIVGALAALCLAASVGQQVDPPARSTTPFADALGVGGVPGATNGLLPATREASQVESCRATCRRCADARLHCR
jgi:hypothetical protein